MEHNTKRLYYQSLLFLLHYITLSNTIGAFNQGEITHKLHKSVSALQAMHQEAY